MPRSLRPQTRRFVPSLRHLSLAIATCIALGACASKSDSQWKGDDGGYGGTGRFNPVGSEAGSSEGQYNNLGKKN